jgi:hypothetical protein
MKKAKENAEKEVNENLFKVIDFMRGHVGANNAIKAKDVSQRFGISTRSVRLIMTTALKKKIIPIISYDGSDMNDNLYGYFVASCYEEVESFIGSLDVKIDALTKKRNLVLECFNEYQKK